MRSMATAVAQSAGATRPQPRGLSAGEVSARRERGEGNVVQAVSGRSYRRIIVENAFTVVNTILFGIAFFLIALGLYGDALMTAGLVLLNVIVGVAQEARAKR